jgi:hypothetical protein
VSRTDLAFRFASPRTWLANPIVRAEIEKQTDKHFDDYQVSGGRIIATLASIAFRDNRAFFEDDGSLKRIQDLEMVLALPREMPEFLAMDPRKRHQSKSV